jgi:hypothetical protein
MPKNVDPLATALNKEATTAAIQEVSSSTIDAESIWMTVFSSILSQMFQRGAAYFIGKEAVLQKELQVAFKTADYAAVEFMRLRDRHGDPIDNARSQLVTEKATVTESV